MTEHMDYKTIIVLITIVHRTNLHCLFYTEKIGPPKKKRTQRQSIWMTVLAYYPRDEKKLH